MMKPSFHLNGTGRSVLLEEYKAAYTAVGEAMEVLADVTTHGRDYYPQGPEAITQALREQASRMSALRKVHEELEQLALHCME